MSVGDEEGRVFEAWSHFASQLVYCHFLQLITITTLLEKLRSKVRVHTTPPLLYAPHTLLHNPPTTVYPPHTTSYPYPTQLAHKRVRKGRDWLMWSLLHFSSTVQSKADQVSQVM